MAVLAGCGCSPDSPAAARHPLTEGDGLAHTTSPRPSPGGEGEDSPALTGTPSQRGMASRMLENIDSLMWKQADSALKVMMEFAASMKCWPSSEGTEKMCVSWLVFFA